MTYVPPPMDDERKALVDECQRVYMEVWHKSASPSHHGVAAVIAHLEKLGWGPKPPRVVKLVKTCDSCPAQWDAEDDTGRALYIRYRHGMLTVQRAPIEAPCNAHHEKAIWLVNKRWGEEGMGCMDQEELAAATKGALLFGEEA